MKPMRDEDGRIVREPYSTRDGYQDDPGKPDEEIIGHTDHGPVVYRPPLSDGEKVSDAVTPQPTPASREAFEGLLRFVAGTGGRLEVSTGRFRGWPRVVAGRGVLDVDRGREPEGVRRGRVVRRGVPVVSGPARARARVRGGVAVSGADDLRTAIGTAIARGMVMHAFGDKGTEGRKVAEIAEDEVMAVLADPVRRLAILEAMGLDVLDGRPYGLSGALVVRPRDGLTLDEVGGDAAEPVVRPRGVVE